METGKQSLQRMIKCAIWGVTAWTGLSTGAMAAPINLGTVGATGAVNNASSTAVESAPYQAPTKSSLTVSQPTSIISQHYIQHNAAPTANYTGVMSIAPSVVSVSPNGPGMMEAQGTSIRGFQDGEFNVTFDGIPWGDSNDFTHHSTSYFMAHDLGDIDVDRGPGNASTIGDATFGGTVYVHSKNPSSKASFNPYGTVGSFGAKGFGLEFNTGDMKQAGDARAFLDYQNMNSGGFLSNAELHREDIFFKVMRPVGDSTMVTFVATHNKLHQNIPYGETLAEIAKFGDNYGLNKDPNSQNFVGYNYDAINTDFEYLGITSLLGNGWTLDNKAYTFGYNHRGYNGLDPWGLATPNGTAYGPNDVPGQKMTMVYRSWGDIIRMAKKTDTGTLRFGAWLDHQGNTRSQHEIDWTLGGALNPPGFTSVPAGGFTPAQLATATDRQMYDTLLTFQPYVDYKWKATPRLTVTPGVKLAYFKRTIDATVNQGSGQPLNYNKNWSPLLPAIDAHYKIADNWTAYAQVAKGFLAPNLNTFYTTDPSASSGLNPQETWNYQIGTAWESNRLAVSGDVYYIDFNNKIGSRKVGTVKVFYNEGGVVYKGIEGEATYYLGNGVSVYGNGSLNSAKDKSSGQWIANAPSSTAAAGLIYNKNGIYAALVDKYVGTIYGDSGQTHKMSGYNLAHLALGYTIPSPIPAVKRVHIKLVVDNLFDKSGPYAYVGTAGDAANTPVYWTTPSRSYYLTLSAHM